MVREPDDRSNGRDTTAAEEIETLQHRIEVLEERLAGSDEHSEGSTDVDNIRRRSLIRGASALGLGVFSSAGTFTKPTGSAIDDDDAAIGAGTPKSGEFYAPRNHDHSGDILGMETPIRSVFADTTSFGRVNGVRYPLPGQVQDAIDAAAETRGHSRIHLHPEITYDPDETWEIKDGVTLDYNGARVRLTTDLDLHDIYPAGRVEQPVVDLREVSGGYTSSVFVFSSRRHGFYGRDRIWRVRGGITRGGLTGGTAFEFDQGNENAIYFVHCDHTVRYVSTVVDMHREDAFGINGNRIFGLWYGFERGIHMHNVKQPDRVPGNISGNDFDVIAQPRDDTKILWDMEVGHHNILRGRFWDFAQYEDVMWRIHEPPPGARKHFGNVLYWHPIGGSESYLFERDKLNGTFDDQHGDPRNRVVVPWMQGRPVSDVSDGSDSG
jgi:hypothetical protein